jgi:tetratricopeptide (TPR) repeat protein
MTVSQPELLPALIDELTALFGSGRYRELEARVKPLLDAHPNSGWLWQMYGLALSGQPGRDAIAPLSHAARLMPQNPLIHINLGNALARVGQQAEAVERYRRALNLDSGRLDALVNLGHCLFALNKYDEAIASYRQGLRLKPGDAEIERHLAAAHLGSGNALAAQGHLETALTHYQSSVQIAPTYAAAYANLGTALRRSGRHSEARQACLKAVELDPQLVSTHLALADMDAQMGDFAGAERRLRQAIAIEPDMAEAWAGLAYLKRISSEDAVWLDKVRALASQGLPPSQEAVLRFALGKSLDDLEQYDEAATHYQRANALARSLTAPYDPARVERTVDAFVHRYDAATLERLRVDGSTSNRPVFVVGMIRSGTTLIEQVLGAHPEASGAGELNFWNGVAASVHGYLDHEERLRATLRTAATRYLELIEKLAPSAKRVIDKMPGNFMHLGLIHAALPGARVIHVTRDPRDNALSIYFQRFEEQHGYAADLNDIAQFRTQYQRLMVHWSRVLPADAVLEVPYGGLVNEPELWTRRMLEFIGLEWDPRCLDFERDIGTVRTASNWQVRQGLQRGSLGRWRHYPQFFEPKSD